MGRARIVILSLALIGLAVSTWSARPDEATSLSGWGFASVWASVAWVVLCILVGRSLPIPAAIGALIALAGCEIFIQSRGIGIDGFFFAIKPVYEFLVGVVGAFAATLFVRMGQQDA
jgi:hypothetical protein